MNLFGDWGIRAAVVASFVALSPVAMAAPSYYELNSLGNTLVGNTLSFGGWSVVFNLQNSTQADRGCNYTSTSDGNNCSNIEMKADVHRGVLQLDFYRIASASGSPPHAQSGNLLVGDSTNANRDLFLNFQVNTPVSTQKITDVSLATTGSTQPTTNVRTTEYLCTGGAALPCATGSAFANVVADTTGTYASYALTTAQKSTSQSLNIRKDLFSTGSGYVITTMTQRYVTNPEPVSMSLIGVGVAGLAAARWRRTRHLAKQTAA